MTSRVTAFVVAAFVAVVSSAWAETEQQEQRIDKIKISAMDKNQDRKVSAEEWRTGSDEHFKQMDRNGDRALDQQEQERMAAAWADEGGESRRTGG
jgi:ABC-type nitrate/sulfonate/bicarbonate transport system substrate-binding protein